MSTKCYTYLSAEDREIHPLVCGRVLFDGDEISDSVVRGVRQNVPLYQLRLVVIGPAFNDLLGQRYAHARQCGKLLD